MQTSTEDRKIIYKINKARKHTDVPVSEREEMQLYKIKIKKIKKF